MSNLDPYTDATAVHIAVLRERSETMGREIGELKNAIKELGEKQDRVLATMAEARGGWRTIVYIAGIASTAGACATWAVQQLKG